MKKMSIAAVFGCVVALAAFSGMSGASDMGDMVEKKCSSCHSTKRICLNLGVKSEAAWLSTVEKMVAKGTPLKSDMVAPVAAYLSGLQPGAGPVCD